MSSVTNNIREFVRRMANSFKFVMIMIGIVSVCAGAWVVSNSQTRSAAQGVFAQLMSPALAQEPQARIQKTSSVTAMAFREIYDEAVVFDHKTQQQQRLLGAYLAKRYRVSKDMVNVLVKNVYMIAQSHHVDPLLVLAIIGVESSFNPAAESNAGAVGLMQVMASVHAEKIALISEDDLALAPIVNIKIGTEILGDAIRRGGSVERGLQLYVGLPPGSSNTTYSRRVLKEVTRLQTIAGIKPGASQSIQQNMTETAAL